MMMRQDVLERPRSRTGAAFLVLIRDRQLATAIGTALRSRLSAGGKPAVVLTPPMSGADLLDPAACRRLRVWWDAQDSGVDLSEAVVVALDDDELAGLGRAAFVGVSPEQNGVGGVRPHGNTVVDVPVGTVEELADAVAAYALATHTPAFQVNAATGATLPEVAASYEAAESAEGKKKSRRLGFSPALLVTGTLVAGGWMLSAAFGSGGANAATMDHHSTHSGEASVSSARHGGDVRDQVRKGLASAGLAVNGLSGSSSAESDHTTGSNSDLSSYDHAAAHSSGSSAASSSAHSSSAKSSTASKNVSAKTASAGSPALRHVSAPKASVSKSSVSTKSSAHKPAAAHKATQQSISQTQFDALPPKSSAHTHFPWTSGLQSHLQSHKPSLGASISTSNSTAKDTSARDDITKTLATLTSANSDSRSNADSDSADSDNANSGSADSDNADSGSADSTSADSDSAGSGSAESTSANSRNADFDNADSGSADSTSADSAAVDFGRSATVSDGSALAPQYLDDPAIAASVSKAKGISPSDALNLDKWLGGSAVTAPADKTAETATDSTDATASNSPAEDIPGMVSKILGSLNKEPASEDTDTTAQDTVDPTATDPAATDTTATADPSTSSNPLVQQILDQIKALQPVATTDPADTTTDPADTDTTTDPATDDPSTGSDSLIQQILDQVKALQPTTDPADTGTTANPSTDDPTLPDATTLPLIPAASDQDMSPTDALGLVSQILDQIGALNPEASGTVTTDPADDTSGTVTTDPVDDTSGTVTTDPATSGMSNSDALGLVSQILGQVTDMLNTQAPAATDTTDPADDTAGTVTTDPVDSSNPDAVNLVSQILGQVSDMLNVQTPVDPATDPATDPADDSTATPVDDTTATSDLPDSDTLTAVSQILGQVADILDNQAAAPVDATTDPATTDPATDLATDPADETTATPSVPDSDTLTMVSQILGQVADILNNQAADTTDPADDPTATDPAADTTTATPDADTIATVSDILGQVSDILSNQTGATTLPEDTGSAADWSWPTTDQDTESPVSYLPIDDSTTMPSDWTLPADQTGGDASTYPADDTGGGDVSTDPGQLGGGLMGGIGGLVSGIMNGVSGIVSDALSGGQDTADWMNAVDSPDWMSDDSMANIAGMLGSFGDTGSTDYTDPSSDPSSWMEPQYPAGSVQPIVLDPSSIAAGEPAPSSDSGLTPADELDMLSQVLGSLSTSDATAPVDETTTVDDTAPVDDGTAASPAPGDVLGALAGIIGGMSDSGTTAPADDAAEVDTTGTDSDTMAQLQSLLDQFDDGSAVDETPVDDSADQGDGSATFTTDADGGESATLNGPGSISTSSGSDSGGGSWSSSALNGIPVGDGTYDLSSPDFSI